MTDRDPMVYLLLALAFALIALDYVVLAFLLSRTVF